MNAGSEVERYRSPTTIPHSVQRYRGIGSTVRRSDQVPVFVLFLHDRFDWRDGRS